MDFPTVLDRLHDCNKLLTITELADIFDVHFTTIERWLAKLDFPKSVGRERVRQFIPDAVAAWVVLQEEKSHGMITMDEVCERVGITQKAYRRWVKDNQAPGPCRRALGSGAFLWDEKEFNQWLQKECGGYARSQLVMHPQPPKKSKKVQHLPRGRKQHTSTAAA